MQKYSKNGCLLSKTVPDVCEMLLLDQPLGNLSTTSPQYSASQESALHTGAHSIDMISYMIDGDIVQLNHIAL